MGLSFLFLVLKKRRSFHNDLKQPLSSLTESLLDSYREWIRRMGLFRSVNFSYLPPFC